jgi:hypothetical protein
MLVRLEIINEKPYLFINCKEFSLINGFSIHLALEELRSLNTGLEIKFENFIQLNMLVTEINKIISNTSYMDLSLISTNLLINELKRRCKK